MMFQEIAPHVLNNQYSHRRDPKPSDFLMVFRSGTLLVEGKEGEEKLLTCEWLGDQLTCTRLGEEPMQLTYLIEADGIAFYLWNDPEEVRIREWQLKGCRFIRIKALRTMKPQWTAYGAATAFHLWEWYRKNQYCGACGKKMKQDEKERAMRCPFCGNIVYPRISPGIIVRVTNGDKILLTKYAGRDVTTYALVAGFTEIGETLEETVRREVMEETGVRVKNIRYYTNQPWQFSQSLLVGFYAELDGDDHITVEEEELSLAVWMTREEMPDRSGDISMTAQMMENFRLGIS